MKVLGGIVYMGNDTPCKIKCISDVQFKMHDGTIWHMTDVWFIPNMSMKKELIALESL